MRETEDQTKSVVAETLIALIDAMSDQERVSILSMLKPKASDDSGATPPPKQNTSVKEDFRVVSSDGGNNVKRRAVRASKNSWSDSGEHKEEGFNPEDFKKIPRERKPPKKLTKNCTICSKPFEIHADLVYGTVFRCDRCTGK